MTDIVRKVVTKYSADTSEHVSNVTKATAATDKQTEALKRQAESAKLVSGKFAELGKSMVGLQINETFKRLSDGAREATGGLLDLNAAFAGYQIAGPWGAAIAAAGSALLKLGDDLNIVEDKIGKLVRENAGSEGNMPSLTREVYALGAAVQAQNRAWEQLPGILANVNAAFGGTYKALGQARKDMAAYDASLQKSGWSFAMGLGGTLGKGIQKRPTGERYDNRAPGYYTGAEVARQSSLAAGVGIAADSTSYDADGFGIDLAKVAQQNLTDKLTSNWFELSNKLGARGDQPSITEQMFGKVEEINAYQEAFSALTGTAVSAYDALVEGNKSAGAAVKAFLKDAIKGLGARMLIRSLEETAEGFAALSNPFTAVSAATRFKSAALFAAGAVAAGAVASGLGGGGGGGGASSRSSGGGSSRDYGGPQGYAGGKAPIIVIGDAFAQDSPRSRQRAAKRIVAAAGLNTSAGEDN